MRFGEAQLQAEEGKKIARAGWNGKNQWVVVMPALYLDAGVINGRTSKHLGEGVDLDSQPYFALYNAAGQWQPGWVPSTGDLFATDWEVLS